MRIMLVIKNLSKTFKSKSGEHRSLKNISFTVKQGEFVSVMGPSGSGKTTLLNCISGFIKGTSGKILLGNEDIMNINEEIIAEVRQNKLGFVFQDFMLVDALTVKENVYLPQIISSKNISEMEKRTDILLNTFGIADLAEKYPNEISGGQKQRVAVARALSNKPSILLADEPTGNLDSKSGLSVIEAFIDAKKNLGGTILMVTHDAIAASYSDRVIALKDGEIIKEIIRKGTRQDFLNEILMVIRSTNGSNYED